MITDIAKIFIPATISFVIGIVLAFPIAKYLYRNEMWKKKAKEVAFDGSKTPIFNKIHAEREVRVPRMGGVIIWSSVLITTFVVMVLSKLTDVAIFNKLDFFSRGQTWLPFVAMLVGALVGLLDDYLEVKGVSSYVVGGLSLKKRLLVVGVVSLLAGLWFYFKLDVSSVAIPIWGELSLGIFFIPFFMLVALAVYSGGIIDGIDGLAGGIFSAIFSAYAGVAFVQNQINLAAFCAVVVGAILAFLWFNIPPARFYMSETGSMALTLTLTIVAFMTDVVGDGHGVSVLFIIALPLFVTSLSVIIQVLSKRFRGKKVFLVAPLHHHFEALGWPAYKVTMRYWVISIIFAIVGMIIAFIA
jgi:phospho-N-acetylmuramoyl-pentapeptide-transferase